MFGFKFFVWSCFVSMKIVPPKKKKKKFGLCLTQLTKLHFTWLHMGFYLIGLEWQKEQWIYIALHIQATKVESNIVLSQIISFVERTQMSKAPIQKFANFVSIVDVRGFLRNLFALKKINIVEICCACVTICFICGYGLIIVWKYFSCLLLLKSREPDAFILTEWFLR